MWAPSSMGCYRTPAQNNSLAACNKTTSLAACSSSAANARPWVHMPHLEAGSDAHARSGGRADNLIMGGGGTIPHPRTRRRHACLAEALLTPTDWDVFDNQEPSTARQPAELPPASKPASHAIKPPAVKQRRQKQAAQRVSSVLLQPSPPTSSTKPASATTSPTKPLPPPNKPLSPPPTTSAKPISHVGSINGASAPTGPGSGPAQRFFASLPPSAGPLLGPSMSLTRPQLSPQSPQLHSPTSHQLPTLWPASASQEQPHLLRPAITPSVAKAMRPKPSIVVPDFPHRPLGILPTASATAEGGKPIPKFLYSFRQLQHKGRKGSFNHKLLFNMLAMRYLVPSTIQRYAIPIIASGRDLIATSVTGSGKTAAYLLPLLNCLMKRSRDGDPLTTAYPLAIILLPTRELVAQVVEECSRLYKGTHLKAVAVAGGTPTIEQAYRLYRGCDLLVGTPGRVMDLVSKRKVVNLARVALVVVDEADKMLDLGFEPELRRLFAQPQLPGPEFRQGVMFSTSLSPEMMVLAKAFLRPDVVTLCAGHETGASLLVTHRVLSVSPDQKLALLVQHIAQAGTSLVIVFTNTMVTANMVHAHLVQRSDSSISMLHSGVPQGAREEAMQCFRYGITPVLVATGLAARGVDVPDVAHVINFDAPHDETEFVNRCGRTGRVNKRGTATTYFTAADTPAAPMILRVLRAVGQPEPDWLLPMAEGLDTADQDRLDCETASGPSTGAPTSTQHWAGNHTPVFKSGRNELWRMGARRAKLEYKLVRKRGGYVDSSVHNSLPGLLPQPPQSLRTTHKSKEESDEVEASQPLSAWTLHPELPEDGRLMAQWRALVTNASLGPSRYGSNPPHASHASASAHAQAARLSISEVQTWQAGPNATPSWPATGHRNADSGPQRSHAQPGRGSASNRMLDSGVQQWDQQPGRAGEPVTQPDGHSTADVSELSDHLQQPAEPQVPIAAGRQTAQVPPTSVVQVALSARSQETPVLGSSLPASSGTGQGKKAMTAISRRLFDAFK